jgi:hypothetical protein
MHLIGKISYSNILIVLFGNYDYWMKMKTKNEIKQTKTN